MKNKKILLNLLPVMLLTSCGEATAKYQEPKVESFKNVVSYEEFDKTYDTNNKEFKIFNDVDYSASFVTKVDTGAKTSILLKRKNKEYKNNNEESLLKFNGSYDDNNKVSKIDAYNKELTNLKYIGDDDENIVEEYSKAASATKFIQDEIKDEKTIAYEVSSDNKTYKKVSSADVTAYEYTASMSVIFIALSNNVDVSYDKASDEQKKNFKFYCDNNVLTQTYNYSSDNLQLQVDDKIVGTYKTNISYTWQYFVDANSLKYVSIYSETTVNNYTVDNGDYLANDVETITKNSYLNGEIKLGNVSLSKIDLSSYTLVD